MNRKRVGRHIPRSTYNWQAIARISSFSAGLRVVLGACVLAYGITAFASGSVTLSAPNGVVTNRDFASPWDNPNPTIAVQSEDDLWSAAGQAMIPLDNLDPGVPLIVEQVTAEGEDEDDSPYLSANLMAPGAQELPGQPYSPSLTLSYGGDVILPGVTSAELWVRTRSRDPWTARVRQMTEIETLSGTVSGIGPRMFRYDGPATSARVSARGADTVRVEMLTPFEREEVFSSSEHRDRTISWEDDQVTVFIVSNYGGETPWTIDFAEATPSSVAPDAAAENPASSGIGEPRG